MVEQNSTKNLTKINCIKLSQKLDLTTSCYLIQQNILKTDLK